MAVEDAYATAVTYRALIRRNDNADDAVILDDLKAVSRYLDKKLHRFFTKDVSAVARVYYPEGYLIGDPEAENPWRYVRGSRELRVDDIASSAGLSIKIDEDRDGSFADETALASTDYQLLPLNADKGPEPKPWNTIYLPAWSTKSGWPTGSPVEVTATFGWAAVPKAIERATCHLTAIVRLESARALNGLGQDVENMLDVAPEGKRIVAELAKAYARKDRLVV